MSIGKFVKQQRAAAGLTQAQLAEKAGVGLRFIREMEQGKQTLRLDTVNQVLSLFGYEAGAVPARRADLTDERVADNASKPKQGTNEKRRNFFP